MQRFVIRFRKGADAGRRDPDSMRGERRGNLFVALVLGSPQEQHVAIGREPAAVVRDRLAVPGVLQKAGVKIGVLGHGQNATTIWL